MKVVQRLRAQTSASHERVDAAFGTHDLTQADSYARFLHAHALALPAAEAVLAADPALPAWRERTGLLAADLADLGQVMPEPLPFVLPMRPGASWGALYVTEGSRLGGVMLVRGVPPTLPSRYLGARHESGEWRTLLASLENAALTNGEDWTNAMFAGADACFTLYARAAE